MAHNAIDVLGAKGGPSRHALFLLKPDLTIHWFNEIGRVMAERAWGRTPRQGDSLLDFAVSETVGDFKQNVARAIAGESSSVRRALAYPSGLVLVFDVFYDPIPDATGAIALVAFSAVDVTADVQRGEVVRLLAAGLAQTADGVMIAEATGDLPIVYVNEASLRITGYEREDIIGRNCRFFRGEDGDQDGVREMAAALREQRACEVIVRNYRKNGERFYNQVSLSPIRSRTGELTHYIGVQRDVTEQRQLEERLSAVERMEALGRLASGVAHDMNNLLMAILGNVGLLHMDAVTVDRHGSELGRIQDTISRARALTNQLLTFARTRVSEPVVLDVGRHISGLSELLNTLLPADVRLVLRIEPSPLLACIDPAHVEQLVVNLAVNARDAMARGGVIELSVLSDEGTLELGKRRWVKIEVRDTGEGMDDDVMARAFEPFFTTKPGGKGTGLGLATCFGIAKQYGGNIALTSKRGQGTTCSVWLPRCEQPEATEPAAPPVAGVVPSRKARVLLVEDDESVRFPLAEVLRRFGYEVLEANDGPVAIALMKSTEIDVLVTDVVLPNLGGSEVAAVCHELHPHAAQIFATGYGGPELASRGIPPQAALLEKPFSPSKLAEKVDEMLATTARSRSMDVTP